MYLSMMSEVMDEKPWLEEDEYSKKNSEIVAKILDMFDRNVTLGDKRRIAKYREVLQSRIKEKGFSIEIRNWKRRYTYQGKEYEKKLVEIKNENSALKKKQQEDQQTIKLLEDHASKSKSEIQELRSDVKYGEREKSGQELLYKQHIQKLENDLAEEKKKVQALRIEIRDKEVQSGENKGKLMAAENENRTYEKMIKEKEEAIARLEKSNSELQTKLSEKEQKIRELEKQVNELKKANEEQQRSTLARATSTTQKPEPAYSGQYYPPSTPNSGSVPSKSLSRSDDSLITVDGQTGSNPFGNSTTITINHDSEMELIPQNVESLSVNSNCCNNVVQFALMNLSSLRSIYIGDECFSHVQRFILANLQTLTTIKIGTNSFTKKLNGWEENKSRSFKVSNCPNLTSITIGQYSFSDYGGEFELEGLPRLESLYIGVFDKESWNFSCSSFVLRDLPMLKSVILGDKTFGFSTHTVFESKIIMHCILFRFGET